MSTTKEKTPISLIEAILVFVVSVGLIILFSKVGLPTGACTTITGVLLALYNVFRVKMKSNDCAELFYQKVGSSMSAIAILLLSAFNAVTWAMSGTSPFLVIAGLRALTPGTCLILSFVLMFVLTMVTGQAWGLLPTLGLACFTVGNALGLNPALMAATIISGTYMGETLAPLSDGTNYQAAMIERDVMTVVKGNAPATVPGAAVAVIILAVVGFSTKTSGTASMESARAMADTIAATGNYTVISLLPIVVMLVLIILKINLYACIFSSSLCAIILAMLTNGHSVVAVVSNAWNGMASATGDAIIDSVFTLGGVSGMGWTVFVIFGACVFASQLIASGVPTIILDKLVRFCANARSLSFTTIVASLVLMLLTGGQYTVMTLISNVFNGKYKEINVDNSVLARCSYNYSSMVMTFIPWSSMCAATFALIGYTGNFYDVIPYCFAAFASFFFIVLWAAIGKFAPPWNNKVEKAAADAAE